MFYEVDWCCLANISHDLITRRQNYQCKLTCTFNANTLYQCKKSFFNIYVTASMQEIKSLYQCVAHRINAGSRYSVVYITVSMQYLIISTHSSLYQCTISIYDCLVVTVSMHGIVIPMHKSVYRRKKSLYQCIGHCINIRNCYINI